jgi:hypothetical protein
MAQWLLAKGKLGDALKSGWTERSRYPDSPADETATSRQGTSSTPGTGSRFWLGSHSPAVEKGFVRHGRFEGSAQSLDLSPYYDREAFARAKILALTEYVYRLQGK